MRRVQSCYRISIFDMMTLVIFFHLVAQVHYSMNKYLNKFVIRPFTTLIKEDQHDKSY